MIFTTDNKTLFKARIYIPELSTGSEQLKVQIGYGHEAHNNELFYYKAAGFEYDTTYSANWRYIRADANTKVSYDSGIPVTVGWHNLSISKTGSQMTFSVDGTSAALTGGYPETQNSQNLVAVGVYVKRLLAAGAFKQLYVDYIYHRHEANNR